MVKTGSSAIRVSWVLGIAIGGLMKCRVSSFSSTVENTLCMSSHNAYAVQRGSDGRIMRKEVHVRVVRWRILLIYSLAGMAK